MAATSSRRSSAEAARASRRVEHPQVGLRDGAGEVVALELGCEPGQRRGVELLDREPREARTHDRLSSHGRRRRRAGPAAAPGAGGSTCADRIGADPPPTRRPAPFRFPPPTGVLEWARRPGRAPRPRTVTAGSALVLMVMSLPPRIGGHSPEGLCVSEPAPRPVLLMRRLCRANCKAPNPGPRMGFRKKAARPSRFGPPCHLCPLRSARPAAAPERRSRGSRCALGGEGLARARPSRRRGPWPRCPPRAGSARSPSRTRPADQLTGRRVVEVGAAGSGAGGRHRAARQRHGARDPLPVERVLDADPPGDRVRPLVGEVLVGADRAGRRRR